MIDIIVGFIVFFIVTEIVFYSSPAHNKFNMYGEKIISCLIGLSSGILGYIITNLLLIIPGVLNYLLPIFIAILLIILFIVVNVEIRYRFFIKKRR